MSQRSPSGLGRMERRILPNSGKKLPEIKS
jgi:hypothetical protein